MPRILFEKIAHAILPERYDLSLVICGDVLARKMNKEYRLPTLKLRQASKKNYAPNVLSFPLEKYEGEMFLNVQAARREAKEYGISLQGWLVLLFVHGCLHLKGVHHGRTMEKLERRIARRFGF